MDDHTSNHQTSIQESQTGQVAPHSRPSGEASSLAEQRILEAMAKGIFDQLPGAGQQARPPLNAQKAANLAEQRILAAMDDGLFDHLPGAGKPIDLYDDMHIPADMRMAYRLLKGQQLAPPWIELQKDLKHGQEQYRTWLNSTRLRWPRLQQTDQDKALAELRRRVNDLNTIIHSLNASVPSDSMRVGLLTYERDLRILQETGTSAT